MTAPSPAAEYLEGRFERVQALHAIYARLTRQMYHQGYVAPGEYHRLKRRRSRVIAHIARLTGDTP